MLRVVTDASKFSPDRSKGVVIVESDNKNFPQAWVELTEGGEARTMALAFASSLGMSSPRINGNIASPFAVNSERMPLDMVRDANGDPLSQTHLRMQPAFYRVEVPVVAPLL